jgi:hypothetical protein
MLNSGRLLENAKPSNPLPNVRKTSFLFSGSVVGKDASDHRPTPEPQVSMDKAPAPIAATAVPDCIFR